MSKRTNNFAIAGLGITPMGRIYGKTAAGFAQEAVQLAAADAGINVADIDGLLINSPGDLNVQLQKRLGLRNTKLLAEYQSFGSSAGAMIQYAGMAIDAGMAETVVCVFADAPLKEGIGAGAAYGARRPNYKGFAAMQMSAGTVAPILAMPWPRDVICSPTEPPRSSLVRWRSSNGSGQR